MHSKIRYRFVEISVLNDFEESWLEITRSTSAVTLGVVYRSPHSYVENAKKLFQQILQFNDKCKHLVFLGGINFPNIDSKC